VTNTGNIGLSNINVSDDQGVVTNYISGDDNADGILDTNEIWVYEGYGTAIVGDYSNLGIVTGDYTDDLGNSVTVTDDDPSHYWGTDPNLVIDKVTNGTDHLEILNGSDIRWTYTVTNTGNVGISNVSVSDDNGTVDDTSDDFIATYADGDINQNSILDTNETWTYEANGTAIAGEYHNVGIVTGNYTDDLGNFKIVTDDDHSRYFGTLPKKVTLEKNGGADSEGFIVNLLDGTETALKYNGEIFTQSDAGNWQALEVATFNDQNQVLWKNPFTQQIGIWEADVSWNYVSAEVDPIVSPQTLMAEVDFQIDINGDGILGDSRVVIEDMGSVKLLQGIYGIYHVQPVDSLTNPEPVQYLDEPFNDYGNWQAISAEIVDGTSQVLWKNKLMAQIGIWDTNASWNYVSAAVHPIDSLQALRAEIDFQVDINGDGMMGNNLVSA
jgi:hypothetical protein